MPLSNIRIAIFENINYFIGLGLVFMAPVSVAMIAVGFLIGIDLIFGIVKARKLKEKFSSTRLSESAIKMLVYQLLIITGHIIETTLITYIPVTQMILSFLGMIELLSIGESFTKITGLPFLAYIKKFIKNQFKNEDIRKEIEGPEEE